MTWRKEIRSALKARLVGNTRALDQVTTNRAEPWKKRGSPGIAIYTLEDVPHEKLTAAPEIWTWAAEIGIELYLAAGKGGAGGASTGQLADDDLDDFGHEVQSLILQDPTLGLDDELVELVDVFPSTRGLEVGFTRRGQRLVGDARLSWTWVYVARIVAGDPTQIVPLETVGAEFDLPATGEDVDATTTFELEQGP